VARQQPITRADAITVVNPAWSGLISEVSNPFPASGGADHPSTQR
jgi:hypothetical protein